MAFNQLMTEKCENTFFFKVGAYACIVVRDSSYREGAQVLFPQISSEEINRLSEENHSYFEERFEISCLLVDTGKHLVLMDTGWGTGWTPEENRVESGRLADRLQRIGVQFSEIDTVIISHGHADHINGNTDDSGNPLFPNARYVICEDEWLFWTRKPDLTSIPMEVRPTMLSSVQKNMVGIHDCFDIVGNNAEILPGIRCINTPGHTPGHTAHMISSGDEQLLCCADTFHHPLQLIQPEWSMVMDIDSEQAVSSRIRFLNAAVQSNSLAFVPHFLFPCLGHIEKNEEVWSWKVLRYD